ncbi:uncharacterized protein LOC116165779 [Photinus pyralis]|uniref:uncharacterized protein LOC116165779 n=1 Tax=Photinus pyralis TaxID=7054 RepID=UPI0012673C39|nr:uncharacterized protein LOC116165779 [Photinus pyralis]
MSMEKPTSSTHAKCVEENSPTSEHKEGGILSQTFFNDSSIIQLPNTKEETAESKETRMGQNMAVTKKSDTQRTISLAEEIDRIIYEDSACSQPPPETASGEPDKDSTDDEYSIVSFADLERLMIEDALQRNLRTSGKYPDQMAILFTF